MQDNYKRKQEQSHSGGAITISIGDQGKMREKNGTGKSHQESVNNQNARSINIKDIIESLKILTY